MGDDEVKAYEDSVANQIALSKAPTQDENLGKIEG